MWTQWRALIALPALFLCTACGGASHSSSPATLPIGTAQVAQLLPHHDGLQFCAHLTAGTLAPRGSTHVLVHSISAYISTDDPTRPAVAAITGRYPGWNTPGTTVYNQQFTNTNTVWLEIVHEFPLGIACIEVYGHGLRVSHYAAFANRILVAFSYMPAHGPGVRTQKFIPIHHGPYLPRYSPHPRPSR